MSSIRLSHPTKKIHARIALPGSKSESNRALILNALSGNKLELQNLSDARDTRHLISNLALSDQEINVLDAGTSMRFLTAYYCAMNEHRIITGSERMKERPIAPLVDALKDIGFDVRCKEKERFPPLEILPLQNFGSLKSEVSIAGSISSQFITALLLIAAFLPKGLKINFTTALTSRSYIEMTLAMLEHLSIKYNKDETSITVFQSSIITNQLSISSDWSAASYWYSIAFLADEAEIFLEGLRDDWSQGDRVIADWMKRFGVLTTFTDEGALLRKTDVDYPRVMKLNFNDNPDLAQTFAAMFAARNICGTFSGIESLKIKETDRVAALQCELRKANVAFDYAPQYDFYQVKGNFQLPSSAIKTYNDHRMAMSFAPLALLGSVDIENPEVVEKSYPSFWIDLQKAGFVVSN